MIETKLTFSQLWDVCTDQDAVDLVRTVQDPQLSSKMLVEHALSRFSTDNLSCMVVRFDNHKLRQAADNQTEPIGVEGDAISKRGTLTESEAIVSQARSNLAQEGKLAPPEEAKKLADEIIKEEVEKEEQEKEPGPEMVHPATISPDSVHLPGAGQQS